MGSVALYAVVVVVAAVVCVGVGVGVGVSVGTVGVSSVTVSVWVVMMSALAVILQRTISVNIQSPSFSVLRRRHRAEPLAIDRRGCGAGGNRAEISCRVLSCSVGRTLVQSRTNTSRSESRNSGSLIYIYIIRIHLPQMLRKSVRGEWQGWGVFANQPMAGNVLCRGEFLCPAGNTPVECSVQRRLLSSAHFPVSRMFPASVSLFAARTVRRRLSPSSCSESGWWRCRPVS